MNILFEDKNIIVCIKPRGILSQDGDRENMAALLNSHFEENGEKAEAFPVHRLDRETAGVMVFAKSSSAAAKLSKQISENALIKRYYAVFSGTMSEKSGEMKDLLFRDKQKNKTYTVKRMRKGVRDASLEYNIIGEADGMSLAEILLHTGRTHQIRVQFSSRGYPLSGDGRYGGGSGDLALFAYHLQFPHPVTGEPLSFSAVPDMSCYPWSLFSDTLPIKDNEK